MKQLLLIKLFVMVSLAALSQKNTPSKEILFKSPDFWKRQYEVKFKAASVNIQKEIAEKNNELKKSNKSFIVGMTSVYNSDLNSITGLKVKTNPKELPTPSPTFASMIQQVNCLVIHARPTDRHVDMRDYGIITPVRDQGNCGSCFDFAVVAALETSELLKNGGDASQLDLSEAQVINCMGTFLGLTNRCGSGGFNGDVAGFLTEHRLVTESQWPYTAMDQQGDQCTRFQNNTSPYKARCWNYVTGTVLNPSPGIDAIKTAICKYGSVAAGIHATDNFKAYVSGVYDMNDVGAFDLLPNHMIQIIGWDDNLQAWLIRNSWSTGWGEGGFAWVKYNTNRIGAYANWIEAEYTSDNRCAVVTPPPSTATASTATYEQMVSTFPWNRFYRIQNEQNGLVVEVDDPVIGSADKGMKVQQWTSHGPIPLGSDGHNQEWYFLPAGRIGDLPTFRILNNGFMKFLTDNGSVSPSTEAGNGSANQVWCLEPVSFSPLKVRIKNVQTNKYIELPNGDQHEGTRYNMAALTDQSNQHFLVSAVWAPGIDLGRYTGNLFLLPAHQTGMALDRAGGSLNNGNPVQLYTKMLNNGNQLWNINYDASLNAYFIQPSGAMNKTIEVFSFSNANGGGTGIWDKWTGENTNQRWIILPIVRKPGRFAIFNWNSGKCLDVAGAGRTNGTRVQQYDFAEADNQEWVIEKAN